MDASIRRHSDSERHQFEKDLIALRPALFGFARTLTNNPDSAEDLVQDVIVLAFRARDSFEMGTNLKAWLFQIARNTFLSEKRRSWRSQPLDPEVAERTLTTLGENEAEASLDLDALLLHMLCLPSDQRDALVAVGYLELSYEEAAEALGVATGTVKSRVSRARKALLELFEGQSPDASGLDIEPFRHATRGIPVGHQLHRIAAAYEELYRDFVPPSRPHADWAIEMEVRTRTEVDKAWEQMVASGALDEDLSLADRMLFD